MTPTPSTATDERMMSHALVLAERGLFTTQPNPRVGCVIADGETIVGEGWHMRAGEPHAEALALRQAGARARGATAYVTLEPCAHHGRTPPCADALIEAGVSRVVAATADPNPKALGGLARLRAAGIDVASGLMEREARALNAGFFSRIERGWPWVRLKIAASLDGRTALADGVSKWITGPAAREDVQRWRARSSAILTGIGTVLADDPRLTVRIEAEHRAPLRVILDSTLRTPAGAHVLDGSAPTLMVHARDASPAASRPATGSRESADTAAVRAEGPKREPRNLHGDAEYMALEAADGRLDLPAVLSALAERDINELQVEAGPILSGAFLAAGLVDELLLYLAPILLGDTAQPLARLPALTALGDAKPMTLVEQCACGPDVRLRLLAESPNVHGHR
jgi:diaminohydroxyphosphoribosylaminopyrimidine deaminase / 5-amino-6-(5-phosphoribosylamino)uracil reductase